MSRTAAPTPLRATEYRAEFPDLHAGQWEVVRSPARFKIVCCGRQWGKTYLGAMMAIAEAARGGDVWWVAPTFDLATEAWRRLLFLTRDLPKYRRPLGRPTYRIELASGGSIQVKSADNPDSLRGATLSGIVFDEAAVAKIDAWPTLRPTLSVKGGWALFISTPKGLNWFHDLWESAEGAPGWQRFRFRSVDSPLVSQADVEAARTEGSMSSLDFSQEYEAEFISYATGMFHADWIRHYYVQRTDEGRVFMLGEEAVREDECRKFHSVDLAWSLAAGADYTVISTWAVTPKSHLLLLDVVRGRFEGPDIVPRMRTAVERHGGYLLVEKATRQMSIIQEADRAGLPIRVVTAHKDKVSRAGAATARMERGMVWFPPASTPWYPEIEKEILAFPAGRHDDFTDTLSYAVMELTRQSVYEDRGVRSV